MLKIHKFYVIFAERLQWLHQSTDVLPTMAYKITVPTWYLIYRIKPVSNQSRWQHQHTAGKFWFMLMPTTSEALTSCDSNATEGPADIFKGWVSGQCKCWWLHNMMSTLKHWDVLFHDIQVNNSNFFGEFWRTPWFSCRRSLSRGGHTLWSNWVPKSVCWGFTGDLMDL